MPTENNMLEKLADLLTGHGASDFRTIEERTKYFCPFEAVGMVRQEIRHSNFLAYILDPQRPHGLDDTVLRTFLMEIAQGSAKERLDIHFRDLENARVQREADNIDILITIPKSGGTRGLVVAVELKVDAQEREKQLSDYENRIVKKFPTPDWQHMFCFLTPDGREETTGGGQTWVNLSYTDLFKAADQAIKLDSVSGRGLDLYRDYQRMMRRHGLAQGEIDKELETAVLNIWAKHKEALDFLIDNRPDLLNKLMDSVRNNHQMAERLGNKVSAERSQKRIIRFSFPELTQDYPELIGKEGWLDDKSMLAMELKSYNEELSIAIVVAEKNGIHDETRQQFRDLLTEQLMTWEEPAQRTNPHGWHTFFNETVFSKEELENPETLDANDADPAEKLEGEMRSFLEKCYPKLEKALAAAKEQLDAVPRT